VGSGKIAKGVLICFLNSLKSKKREGRTIESKMENAVRTAKIMSWFNKKNRLFAANVVSTIITAILS
jgi:hypothetical protein